MQPFTQIRESVVYTWNDTPSLRQWAKLLTCPCFGYCYVSAHIPSWLKHGDELRSRKQKERVLRMSEVKQARLQRDLKNRKRSVSIDARHITKFIGRKRQTLSQQQSNFFAKLPLELRLEIYNLVLCSREEIHIRPCKYHNERHIFKYNFHLGRSTAMLRTCRKLYREAVNTLYSGNNLSFTSPQILILFSHSIPAPRLAHIKHITIVHRASFHSETSLSDEPRRGYEEFFSLLEDLPRLRVLDLRYLVHISDGPKSNLMSELELLEKVEMWTGNRGCEVWYEIEGLEKAIERYRLWMEPGVKEGLGRGKWRVGEKTRLR